MWLLLQRGFSVSDIDDCGNTCVHLASASGHHDIVKCLLCSGVDLTATNWYGNTALALATAAATRQLLQRLSEQTKCAATNVCTCCFLASLLLTWFCFIHFCFSDFGPDELMHLCYCCERGFTEDASFPQVVCGSVASETLKPLRYCRFVACTIVL